MKITSPGFLFMLYLVFACSPSQAQLLKKLKDKVSQTANKALGTTPSDSSTSTNTGPGGKPTNKGGAGLKNTPPPDVIEQMKEAETANNAGNYSDARFAVQQALIGVEIQLGRELLKSLPDPVNDLGKDTAQDKVMSTQWGWNNLTIQRVYSDKKDKQLTVTIGNNGFYAGLVNVYFNSAYVEADAKQQNVKQVKVKGNKSIIQYEDNKGYTLITPIGQSSMIVWECINFADENEVMNAANVFDIDGIKKTLGEQ